MIVVDTNVIAYRLIQGDKTALACKVEQKDNTWVVPRLWRHEFLNVLATSARSGVLDIGQACACWRDALRMLADAERDAPYEKALSCAVDARLSAYDAQYITLAQSLNVLCVTEDSRLLKAFPAVAVSMRAFTGS
jgi:predicted nucleic acid-binding protein